MTACANEKNLSCNIEVTIVKIIVLIRLYMRIEAKIIKITTICYKKLHME